MADSETLRRIGILGGTGAEGGGLALRWAHAGHRILIGSRDEGKAKAAAASINARIGANRAEGMGNPQAAAGADVVVLAVPYAAQMETALPVKEQLSGKVLIDVTAPLKPPRVGTVQLPAGGSCVLALQEALGQSIKVVSAFQNVSAHHLSDLAHAMDCDVLVCGDDKEARELVISLVAAAGMNGVHAGPLANSAAAEALTSVLIHINRTYKVSGAGIRITGLGKEA